MSEYYGGNGVYVGSFNPPHAGHIETMKKALETFDTLHMFVRYNQGVDLVDWETKSAWFDRINEELGGRLVIHRMINEAVKGKSYTTEEFYAFIGETVQIIESSGGAENKVTGFVFGKEYEKIIPEIGKRYPDLHFLIVDLKMDGEVKISSTAVREDLEAYKKWIPDYVYASLVKRRETLA